MDKEKVIITKAEMLRGPRAVVVDLRDSAGTLRRSVHMAAGKSVSHRKIVERAVAFADSQSDVFHYVIGGEMRYQWTLGDVALPA